MLRNLKSLFFSNNPELEVKLSAIEEQLAQAKKELADISTKHDFEIIKYQAKVGERKKLQTTACRLGLRSSVNPFLSQIPRIADSTNGRSASIASLSTFPM